MYKQIAESVYPIADFPFFMANESGEGILVPPVFYPASQLILIRSGHVVLTFGTSHYEAKEGDIFFLPGDTVTMLRGSADASVRRAIFDTEPYLSDATEFESNVWRIRDITYRHRAALFPAGHPIAEELTRMLETLREEWAGKELGFRQMIAATLRRLLTLILRDFSDTHYSEARTAHKNILRLCPVIAYIDRHKEEKIMVQTLSELAMLSFDHFEKLFRETLGQTPMSYVSYVRLNAGLCRLITTNDSVSAIAKISGFSSGTYFSRCFTENMGMTPKEFRRLSECGTQNTEAD